MKKRLFIFIFLIISSTIFAKTNWLGKDKIMHFGGSAFITYWNYGVSKDIIGNSKKESLIISISLTTLLGVSKETSDKYLKKTFWSWKDIAYDLAGITVGLILINNMR